MSVENQQTTNSEEHTRQLY